MNALEIYAIAAPAIALVLMGAFGLLLFRRDVASFGLSDARNAGAASPTFNDRSVVGSAANQAETVATIIDPGALRPAGTVGTPNIRELAEAWLANNPREVAGRSVVLGDLAPTSSPGGDLLFELLGGERARTAIPSAAEPGRVPAEAAPPVKPKRNLLFSSSSRKERERAQARTADPAMPDLRPPAAAAPAAADSGEAPPATFDDAWPKPERARAADASLPRRSSGRTPSTFTESDAAAAGAERVSPAPRSEDQPQVTVLKSGVVDGMAYSLYSDGSIEAQMPEGMMRFASIDELRAHLDQRP